MFSWNGIRWVVSISGCRITSISNTIPLIRLSQVRYASAMGFPIRCRWCRSWVYLIQLGFYVVNLHWNIKAVALTKISSLAVLEVVKMTIYCDDNFSMTFSFQCTKMCLNEVRIRTTWKSFIISGFMYIIPTRGNPLIFSDVPAFLFCLYFCSAWVISDATMILSGNNRHQSFGENVSNCIGWLRLFVSFMITSANEDSDKGSTAIFSVAPKYLELN